MHPLAALPVAVICLPLLADALWPLPVDLRTGATALRLSEEFTIQFSMPDIPSDLIAAVNQTKHYLNTDNLGRLVVDRGSTDLPRVRKAKQLTTLILGLNDGAPHARSISDEATLDIGQRDEAYSLTIPSSGDAASLRANTTLGLFRGLTTFSQIWYAVDDVIYSLESPMIIEDSPEFVSNPVLRSHVPYSKSSHIADSCSIPPGICMHEFFVPTATYVHRHLSFPVSDIKRTLDAMSWVKVLLDIVWPKKRN
jgi:hexosaminidase